MLSYHTGHTKLIYKLTFHSQDHLDLCKFRIFFANSTNSFSVQSFDKGKNKVSYLSNVVQQGTFAACSSSYIGEGARNFSILQAEYKVEDLLKLSMPAGYVAVNEGKRF